MNIASAAAQELVRDAARETIALTRAQRAQRAQVRRDARHARFQARRLRDRAAFWREMSLTCRWNLWTVGLVNAPPETIPVSWTRAPDRESAADEAARQCGELAVQAGERFPVVRALCEVTQERLVRRDDQAGLALGLTARMVDLAEAELEGDDVATVLFASACRRCSAACRHALVMDYSEPSR